MGTKQQRPDPVLDADRARKAPPESGPQSESVVGRPAVERPRTAFHEPAETDAEEREPVTPEEARKEGGSYDGVAPLQDL